MFSTKEENETAQKIWIEEEHSTCVEVLISGLGPVRDQYPNIVPKKARFASQVLKLFDWS